MTRIEVLTKLLAAIHDLELSVLVGSQAKGTASEQSDWDIAIQWAMHISGWTILERTEILKQQIADVIDMHRDKVDLIDIASARLAMRAVIAEEGIALKGASSLAWRHHLTRTWAALEDCYWRRNNAA